MDREHVKGAADKAKGAIEEGAGKLTGDKSMEADGKIEGQGFRSRRHRRRQGRGERRG